jgi:hypothetical protein
MNAAMIEKSYQIVVTGELVEGGYLPDVKVKVAALFGTSAEKLDALFSGKRVVIKKGLGHDAAQKYVAAVQKAGLRCVTEMMAAETSPAPAAGPMAGVSVAPVGTVLAEPPAVAAPQIDTSGLSVAPLGGNLVEHAPPEAPSIDTSDLSMAPPGSQLAESKTVKPPAIDISSLDMAPVGSDMGEMERDDAPPPPDTRHLKLDEP